ncbi:hypothetical protein N6H18_15020 [Reichenbachiella agarivorans]|uniref:Addiction module component n=1 Tax=Reichenbachiella agarivorans TaxID=2979464 RepID=A0ABY6CMB8_9BACT|nr:hypothetical protein [Reichenbachiella agarivorans]UXP31659.1 hypothetical protein N6H18_15020 [Reichenbachiella agarivorans]
MNVSIDREIQRNAIHNVVKWVGEIDRREDILPLGNQEEMLALLENAKGKTLNYEEKRVALEMLVNSVVN